MALKYIVIQFFGKFLKKLFCATAQTNLAYKMFALHLRLGLSLIFQQILAWCPYKLGPYKKKKVYRSLFSHS